MAEVKIDVAAFNKAFQDALPHHTKQAEKDFSDSVGMGFSMVDSKAQDPAPASTLCASWQGIKADLEWVMAIASWFLGPTRTGKVNAWIAAVDSFLMPILCASATAATSAPAQPGPAGGGRN